MATPIQVVLQREVHNLGESGDVVRVRPGYARNFLYPRQLALPASSGNLARVEEFKLKGGKQADYYEISMKQISQQILPAGLPKTTVWGYGSVNGVGSKNPLMLHNAPSLTIEALANRPVRIKW